MPVVVVRRVSPPFLLPASPHARRRLPRRARCVAAPGYGVKVERITEPAAGIPRRTENYGPLPLSLFFSTDARVCNFEGSESPERSCLYLYALARVLGGNALSSRGERGAPAFDLDGEIIINAIRGSVAVCTTSRPRGAPPYTHWPRNQLPICPRHGDKSRGREGGTPTRLREFDIDNTRGVPLVKFEFVRRSLVEKSKAPFVRRLPSPRRGARSVI